MSLKFRYQIAIEVLRHVEELEAEQEHGRDMLSSEPNVGVRKVVGRSALVEHVHAKVSEPKNSCHT